MPVAPALTLTRALAAAQPRQLLRRGGQPGNVRKRQLRRRLHPGCHRDGGGEPEIERHRRRVGRHCGVVGVGPVGRRVLSVPKDTENEPDR